MQDFQPRPFTESEYALIVLNDLKRLCKRSDIASAWIHPKHWASDAPDTSDVLDAISYAIEAVRERVERQSRGSRG